MPRPFMYEPHADRLLWLSTITRLAVLVLIVVGIVLLVRYLAHRYPAGGHFHSHGAAGQLPPANGGAMQILEERFARGEIDVDEFKSRKEALRS